MVPINKAIDISLRKSGIFIVLILFSLSACSLVLDRDAVQVKVSSLPAGQPSLKKGKIITLAGIPKKAAKTTKVKFNNLSSEQPSKSTEIVVATFDNQIKLIDFVGPEINAQPDLSFKSTARSLVFMNPLFLGLSFEAKKNIFNQIEKDPDFLKLVDAVANSLSLFDDNIIDLSTQIALRVAENQGIIIVNDNNNNDNNNNDTSNNDTSNNEPSPSPLNLSPSIAPNNVDSNPFAKESFPKKSCGDSFPTDPQDFPVSFYPVFVDYSETNLQKINLNFCEDAYQLIREETGKESIQVGSFTSLDRAEAFKEFMIDKVGSGEVGKPKIYENPHNQSFKHSFLKLFSKLNFQPVIDALIPAANAQIESKWLEYSLVSQFTNDNDDLFIDTDWSLWHGLELKVDSSGIKIVGTPLIAQQIIVLPENATNRSTNAVVDEIIYPANLGTWDGNTIKTLSGGNQVEIDLKPKPGKTWQPGNYDVLISGGSALRRSNSQQGLQAFEINLSLFVTDILALIGSGASIAKQEINDKAINLSKIAGDCLPEVNKEISKEDPQALSAFAQLTQCLAKADNINTIAQIFGVDNEKVITELLSQIIKFEGEAWEKTLKNAEKKAKNVLYIFDSSVALGRIFVFGKYLEHENTNNEFYHASFSVNEITEEYPSRTKTTPFASRTIDLDCSPGNPGSRKYEELDVIIEVSCHSSFYSSSKGGISLIKATNYSENAVEVSFPIPGSRSDLLLPDQSQTYRASIPWHLRDNWKNRPEGIQTSALEKLNLSVFLPDYALHIKI